jgi:hypothetical protein
MMWASKQQLHKEAEMTHMRYWAMMLATAVAGACIGISRFAFTPSDGIWIIFGLAIAAAVCSIAAVTVALLRDDDAFASTSALSALVAGFTVVATRVFTAPSALWIAFAGGIAFMLLAVRALAIHETTVERVVHQLEVNGEDSSVRAIRHHGIEISGTMHSWLYWFSHTAIAVMGAFVVASTFIWRHPTAQLSPQWLAFGVGIVAASIAVGSLADRAFDAYRHGFSAERQAAIVLTATAIAVSGALIALMAILTNAYDLRWWAFGLGAGMAGVSLVSLIVHELTSERVRHELEIARGVGSGEIVGAVG